MVTLELWPENIGLAPPFAVDNWTSVVNGTFAQLPRGSLISVWRVRPNIFSDSDHQYIEYSLTLNLMFPSFPPSNPTPRHGWTRNKMDEVKLVTKLKFGAMEFAVNLSTYVQRKLKLEL